MLDDDDLRRIDELILDYLEEGRVTPIYCQTRMETEGMKYTRGYVHERLTRLGEHDHVRNLYDTGLYELVDDPRENERRSASDA